MLPPAQMSSRDYGTLPLHTFQGTFRGRPAQFKMTSVIGHVLSIDFPGVLWRAVLCPQLSLRCFVPLPHNAQPR